MNKIKNVKTISAQNINLKHLEMIVVIDDKEEKLDLTVSDLNETSPDGKIDNIMVFLNNKKLGVLSEGIIYIAVDSNGDGKIDTNDFGWKAIQLIKEHFKDQMSFLLEEDPYIKGIKAPK